MKEIIHGINDCLWKTLKQGLQGNYHRINYFYRLHLPVAGLTNHN